MRALALCFLLLLTAVEACGGKSKGNEAASAASGGQTPSSVGSSGSAGDDTSADGGVSGDGGAGAGLNAGDGGAPPEPIQPSWCNTQGSQLFCADFDGEPYDAPWSATLLEYGGTVEGSSVRFQSAPRAFLASIPARDDNDLAEARLTANFPAGAEGATLAFDVYVEDLWEPPIPPDPWAPPNYVIEILRIANGIGNISVGLDVPEGHHQICFSDPVDCRHGWEFSDFPLETWVHVEFAVVFGSIYDQPASGSFTLKLDGEIAIHWDEMNTAVPDRGPIAFSIGPSSLRTGPALAAAYDNVTFDLE